MRRKAADKPLSCKQSFQIVQNIFALFCVKNLRFYDRNWFNGRLQMRGYYMFSRTVIDITEYGVTSKMKRMWKI